MISSFKFGRGTQCHCWAFNGKTSQYDLNVVMKSHRSDSEEFFFCLHFDCKLIKFERTSFRGKKKDKLLTMNRL